MKARNCIEATNEVAAIESATAEKIDPKIRHLVIGLRRWGIETTSSCQGHLQPRPRFWTAAVPQIFCNEESMPVAARLLATYSSYYKKQSVWNSAWVIKPLFGIFSIRPERSAWWKLPWLQKDAEHFGKFLQNLPEDFFANLRKDEGSAEKS